MSVDKRMLRRIMRPQFERRYEEDRAKSLELGKLTNRPLDVVILSVIGDGRNTAAIEVNDWLAQCKRMVAMGEMPSDWLDGYKAAYDRFVNGATADEITDGTPLVQWPQIGAAHVDLCLSRGVRTVEELAAVDDSARKFFGPGFIGLQNKARAWVQSAAVLARENAELRKRLELLEAGQRGLDQHEMDEINALLGLH